MSSILKEVKLRFLEGENEGIEIRLEVPREVVIGRGEDCDIYLGEKKISRRHARLVTSKNSLIIEDLKSTNGTFVNGKRINKETLANEDSVRIGTSVFQIDFIHEEAGTSNRPGSGASAAMSERMISEPSGMNSSIPSLVSSSSGSFDLKPGAEASYGNIDIEEKMREVSKKSTKPPTKPVRQQEEAEPSVDIDIDFASAPEPVVPAKTAKPARIPEPSIEVSGQNVSAAEASIDLEIDSEPEVKAPPTKKIATPAVAAPIAAKKPSAGAVPAAAIDAKKALSGNLATMPLHDLLQTFHNARRTGMLKLTGPHKGQIYVQEGKITHAYLEQGVTGEKALFRMLGWKDAEFELVPLPEKFAPPKSLGEALTSSTENLLIEGYRQLDEIENLRKSLPALTAKLRLNPNMDNPLSRLHPRVLDVMQLSIKHGTFTAVLDASTASDLDTAKMIFYLIKKSYLVAD